MEPRGRDDATTLTPAQQRTMDALRRSGEPVVFDREFVEELREHMTEELRAFADRIDDGELWISKHRLATALDCEEHHLAQSEFTWTPANAAGTVAHRAIQLQLSWRGEPAPMELVDEAMARTAEEDRGIGSWLAGLGAADEADLRSQTTVRVTQFLEHFPRLDPRWRPVTEASVRWPLDGPIVLAGRVDLAFGPPAGRESRKVIVDLKTGRASPRHRQDLAFYALLETLTRLVPPRKVATLYLDAGEAQTEDVSERLLRTAVRRTLDGIDAIIALEIEGRAPTRRPGTSCRWCPLAESCADGRRWLDDAGGRARGATPGG